MDIPITKLVDSLLLPPGGPILLGFIGLLLWRHGLGRKLLFLALLLAWLFSLPLTEKLLMAGLEIHPPLNQQAISALNADAIVVLGGGQYYAPEYAKDSARTDSLVRLRYAAWLANRTGLPVIPSGGATSGYREAGARIYADILRNEFKVSVEHIETRSQTTWENARYTSQMMKKLGIDKVILVTHAAHMRRAMYSFERNGVRPTPAPTDFEHTPEDRFYWLDLLPRQHSAKSISYALHEYLGLLWYSFK